MEQRLCRLPLPPEQLSPSHPVFHYWPNTSPPQAVLYSSVVSAQRKVWYGSRSQERLWPTQRKTTHPHKVQISQGQLGSGGRMQLGQGDVDGQRSGTCLCTSPLPEVAISMNPCRLLLPTHHSLTGSEVWQPRRADGQHWAVTLRKERIANLP